MSAEALSAEVARESPAQVVATELPPRYQPVPGQEAVAALLRALWPEGVKGTLSGHARTLVRTLGLPDEAVLAKFALIAGAAEKSVLDPDTKIDVGYGRWLVPWDAARDRRPKSKTPRWLDPYWDVGGPGRGGPGNNWLGSAHHGECTWCVNNGDLREAVYRVVGERDNTQASVCDRCARKLIGGPVVVPKFDTPEEAQAWLDAQE